VSQLKKSNQIDSSGDGPQNNYIILKPKFLNKNSTFDKILKSYDAVDLQSDQGQEILQNHNSNSSQNLSYISYSTNEPPSEPPEEMIGIQNILPNSKRKPKSISPLQRSQKHLQTPSPVFLTQPSNNSLQSVEIFTKAKKISKPKVDSNLKRSIKPNTTVNYSLLEVYDSAPLSNSLEEVKNIETIGTKIVRVTQD
jgi:hypothetical protein